MPEPCNSRQRQSLPVLCAALVLLAALALTAGEATRADDAVDRYYQLLRLYRLWREKPYGTRAFHERKLTEFLVGSLGRQIVTGHVYELVSPEGIYDKKIACRFPECSWLHIDGELDAASARDIAGGDTGRLKAWWRAGLLVSVSGTLKDFRLGRDPRGDAVYLKFDRLVLREGAGTEPKKKD